MCTPRSVEKGRKGAEVRASADRMGFLLPKCRGQLRVRHYNPNCANAPPFVRSILISWHQLPSSTLAPMDIYSNIHPPNKCFSSSPSLFKVYTMVSECTWWWWWWWWWLWWWWWFVDCVEHGKMFPLIVPLQWLMLIELKFWNIQHVNFMDC